MFGVVVARAQRAHAREGRDGDRGERLGSAGHDDVGAAVTNQADALADRVRSSRTSGADAERRAGPAEPNRDHTRGRVRHHHRDEERADARRALLQEHLAVFLHGRQAADARCRDDRAPLRVRGELARVGERVRGRAEAQLRDPVLPAQVFRIEVRLRSVIADLAREAHRDLAGVEARDRSRGRTPDVQRLPERREIVAGRRLDAHARDDHTRPPAMVEQLTHASPLLAPSAPGRSGHVRCSPGYPARGRSLMISRRSSRGRGRLPGRP